MTKKNEATNNSKPMAYDTLLCTVIYLVNVCSGQYEVYTEREIFATADKERAEKWRDKYNRIIDNNKERIKHYYDDGNYEKEQPFWYDKINYDSPMARVIEVKWR